MFFLRINEISITCFDSYHFSHLRSHSFMSLWLNPLYLSWAMGEDVTYRRISLKETQLRHTHYDDVIMGTIASQITSLTIVYSAVYSGADQSKHQSSASLAFVWGIHRGPVNSPHKWPVTRKMFPFDDVIMIDPLYLQYISLMIHNVSAVLCFVVVW